MNPKLQDFFSTVFKQSPFITRLELLLTYVQESNYRKLAAEEIDILKKNGNRADSWQNISVAEQFLPERIVHCSFSGECRIGRFSGEAEIFPGCTHPSGLYNSTIASSVIGDDVLVTGNSLVSRTVIAASCTVFNSCIYCDGDTSFGNGTVISAGIESGGREIPLCGDLTMDIVRDIALAYGDMEIRTAAADFQKAYVHRCRSQFSILDEGCRVLNTKKVRNSCIGPGAVVDGAACIDETSVISSVEEPVSVTSGSILSGSIIQKACTVQGGSIVEGSLLLEHTQVERHGKVLRSIVGPDGGVAEGEINSSIVGPFVGFHHQALLIAAFWPDGKGNIGYGADVGSNHTSRVSDQEIRPGEGMFFGLGCNIKFPADFSAAPYSIIATGVSVLPQRMEFPFSLVAERSTHLPAIPPGLTELFPGWVLYADLYMVMRCENKYRSRKKSTVHRFPMTVFRPDILLLVQNARDRLLEGMREHRDRQHFLPGEIGGIGKNFVSAEYAEKGADAYTFFLDFYTHRRFTEFLAGNTDEPFTDDADLYKQFEKTLGSSEAPFFQDFYGDVTTVLERYSSIADRFYQSVFQSKEKDSIRGGRIIPDYKQTHPPVQEDPVVKSTERMVTAVKEQIELLLKRYHFPL